jgi:signal peptidase I
MELDGSRPQAAPAQTPSETAIEHKQPTELLVREIIETLLLTLFIFWIVNTATGRFRIEGSSMVPTLEEGEYLIINKLSYFLEDPERGDVIVLNFPQDRNRDFIKRIIAVPGDHIEIGDGVVKINGQVLDEPYINASPSYAGVWDVPDDQYFVLGDNRNNSSDSHNWSFLPADDIVGKAWVIYWGPENWGLVPHFPQNIS